MIARLPGTMIAAPMPCMARNAMSTPGPGAIAQASDETTNSAMPATKARRSPNRSPAAPPARMRADSVSA